MPTFATPEWISADIDIVSGDIALRAWDRPVTEVAIEPASRRREDVAAAEQATVECQGGRLVVRQGDRRGWWWHGGDLRVLVSLPEGSAVEAATRDGDVSATGRLGDVRAKTSDGDVRLGDVASAAIQTADGDVVIGHVAGDLRLSTGDGDVAIGDVTGRLELSTGNGDVSAGALSGPTNLRSADGDIRVRALHGHAQVRTADGDVRLDRSDGEVDIVTGCGDVIVTSCGEGTMRVSTSDGDVRIGVLHGTSAWLDLDSADGDVVSELEDAAGPSDGHAIARIHARTSSGDVVVTRART